MSSLAGCNDFLSKSHNTRNISDKNTPAGTSQEAGREIKSTKAEITNRFERQEQKARSYTQSIPATWPSKSAFSYEKIQNEKVDVRFASGITAEPAVGGKGDRILLTPKDLEPGETASALRGRWGVPEKKVVSAEIKNTTTNLHGGEGITIAGFTGVVSLEGEKMVAGVRGIDYQTARKIAKSFDNLF